MDSTDVRPASQRAGDHPALETIARIGYAVNGVLHIIIGAIALALAFGSKGASADQSGALGSMAENPLGKVVLWIAVVAWLGLGIWQLTEAISGSLETSDRVKAVAKAVVYLALSWTAFRFASGSGSSSKKQSTDFTATLMEKPAGQWLVGAVGPRHHRRRRLPRRQGVEEEVPRRPGDPPRRVDRQGRAHRLHRQGHRPRHRRWPLRPRGRAPQAQRGQGLDGALRNLLGAPGGPVLLALVALGLIAFGVYSFGRARHADV